MKEEEKEKRQSVFEKYGVSSEIFEAEISLFLKEIVNHLEDIDKFQEVTEEEIRKFIAVLKREEFEEKSVKITDYEFKVFLLGMIIGQLFKEINDRMQMMATMERLSSIFKRTINEGQEDQEEK